MAGAQIRLTHHSGRAGLNTLLTLHSAKQLSRSSETPGTLEALRPNGNSLASVQTASWMTTPAPVANGRVANSWISTTMELASSSLVRTRSEPIQLVRAPSMGSSTSDASCNATALLFAPSIRGVPLSTCRAWSCKKFLPAKRGGSSSMASRAQRDLNPALI